MLGLNDRLCVPRKHFPETHQIERVSLRPQRLEIFFRQTKQPDGRTQAPSMFRMRRILELLLQMDESAGSLDQPFEILRVVGCCRRLEPDLLQDIVGLIITLLVPAAEKCPVIGVIGNRITPGFGLAAFQPLDELGNSLAFAHGVRNLVAPAMMGKRARFSLREGERLHDRRRSEK